MSTATIAEADAEFARNVGAQQPQQAWILSDRDVWYRNPSYRGPPVPHPEDCWPEEDWPAEENTLEQSPETGHFPHDA